MQGNSLKNINKPQNKAIVMANYQRHIHYDLEVESAVLGACMLESSTFSRIRGLLKKEYLYSSQNQAVFDVLSEMWEDGLQIDLLTVAVEIHSKGKQGAFNGNVPYYLTVLTTNVVNTTHLETHALYIRQMYAKRLMLNIQMEASAGGKDTVDSMLDIQQKIQEVLSVNATDDWQDIGTVMLRLSKHMDKVRGKTMLGVPSGFPSLDKISAGWQEGQLIVLGARPSVGKTAFAAALAINAAKNQYPVGIINLEMPSDRVGGRLVSFYSDIEFWRIYRAKSKDQDQEGQIHQAISDVANLPIWISDKTNVTVSDIRAKAQKLKNRADMKLLIIDYLQLMEGEGKVSDNREREVAKMSRGLKLLALDLKIPVIVLVQLNRESDKTGNKKPRMSNIRESGAIEQDADDVLLLHRDWKSGIQTDANGNSTERQATLIIEKMRDGECAELQISFEPETMKFYEETYQAHGDNPF